MKHLLFLLSILIISLPVIAQETGVLYQYETYSGIKWKNFGDGKVQPKYTGEIKNGEMNGLGVLIYPYGGKSVVGEWRNGNEWNTKHKNKVGKLLGKVENGKWGISWGVLYLGYRNSKFYWHLEKWKGLETKDNKDIGEFEGEIKNNLPNGPGTLMYSNGERYLGEWKDGKEHGQGTFNFTDGRK